MDADVIVVGAGAAGLAAARSLAARSMRVLLIEARDRVGGRIWSRQTSRTATPAELGAEFIHGRALQTMALLRDAGTAAIDVGSEYWVTGKRGRLQRDESAFMSAAKIFEATRELDRDESVDRFLRRFERDERMQKTVAAARDFVEGFEAADPAIASTRGIAFEWQSGVDSTSARPLGGYPPLLERLRAECIEAGVRIELSTVVRAIAWQRGNVKIGATNSRGMAATFRARFAIVTLPIGVLRHNGDETAVVFEPALPAAKQTALASIEMGHAVKVVLWFHTPFWERLEDGRYRDGAFFRSEGQAFQTYWTLVPVRSELVVAWAGGPKAYALRGLASADLVEEALNGFSQLFDAPDLTSSEFEGGLTHDWTSDPFSRGAYSYVAVDGANARAELAAQLDETLFFAGEATSTDGQGGTVNGALATGERAAAEVAARG